MQRRTARPRSPGVAALLRPPLCLQPSWRAFRYQQFSPLRRHRQAYQKRATDAVRIVSRHDFAVMRVNDAVTNTQPQTCALADFLRREERIEDALGMRNARTVVAECDLHVSIAMRRRNLHFSGTPHFLNRVVGVVKYVEKYLLELVRIPDRER